MTDHRWSYRKTVFAAALASGGAVVVFKWVTGLAWHGLGPWTPGAWLACAAAVFLFAPAIAWPSFVVIGGLIALQRDSCEARGVPYAPRRRREWLRGPLLRSVRGTIGGVIRLLRPSARLDLHPGELVEVRSLEEVLETLDDRGTLNGLPFMPEMVALCGKRFRVFRRVDKLNDWVGHTGLRRVRQTVTLEGLRCDGRAHGGCQAACHMRWNEAWLKRSHQGGGGVTNLLRSPVASAGRGRTRVADLERIARTERDGVVRYFCQVTELARGTTPLAWADPRHYLRDLLSGNIRFRPLVAGAGIAMFNWVQRRRGGIPFPYYAPGAGSRSPSLASGLQPGELVRVRTKAEIEPTLTARSRNRGLWFDVEMLRFCGGKYRVRTRVERLIEEQTGKLIHVSNPSIILDGVVASGEYLGFCAQAEAIFWREIWLDRVCAGNGVPNVTAP